MEPPEDAALPPYIDKNALAALLITRQYCLAMTAGVCESLLRGWVLGMSPFYKPIFLWGLAMVFIGEAVRKTAMIQAGKAFTHLIKAERRPGHELITTGTYSVLRHPGYFGWFVWAIGTQATEFMRQRIPVEEQMLQKMFGEEYTDYARKHPILIPTVTGLIPYSRSYTG